MNLILNNDPLQPQKNSSEKPSSVIYSADLIPSFTETEIQDLKAYLEINKKYSEKFKNSIREELKSSRVWGPIISKMNNEMMQERENISRKLQDEAIINGNWEPYVQDLITQGRLYAQEGINFKNWLEIVSLVRKNILPVVEKESGKIPEKSISILRGMNLMLDYAITIIGETYLHESKKIIETQKITVAEEKQVSQYVRSLIEASIDPLGTINTEGIITDVNEAAVKATGVSREEMVGSDFSSYYTEPDKVKAGYKKAFQKGYIKDYPLTIKHKSGKLTDVLFNASVYKDQHGNVIGLFGAGRDVSAQMKAKTTLKQKTDELAKLNIELIESEQQMKAIFDSAPDAVIVIDQESNIVKWNKKAETIFGWLESEVSGKKLYHYIIPEHYRKSHINGMKHYLQTGEGPVLNKIIEIEAVNKNGTEFSVLLSISPAVINNNKLFIGFVRDNTDKKKAEAILKEYEYFFKNSHDLVCIANLKGYFEIVNPNFQKVLGYTEKELLEVPYVDFIHPDDVHSTLLEIDKLKSGLETVSFVNRYRKKDGSYVWFDWNTTPDVSKGKLYAAARDITERKKAEDELRNSENFLNSIIENIPNMIFVKDAKDLKFVRFNKAGEELLGYTESDLIGKNDYDFFPKEEADFFTEKDRNVLNSGKLLLIPEEPIHTKHKGERIFETKKIRINDSNGKPIYLLGISNDITEQKQAFQYARSLIEASLDPLVTISPEGKITDVNEATVKILGVSREKLIGTVFSDYFTEPEKAKQAYLQVFQKGYASDYPLTIKHINGELTDVLYNASVYKDIQGNVLGVFASARDVTAQKQLAARDAERAKELMRMEELEKFRELTVGRELKMIELKKEIEELKNKITETGNNNE